MAYRRGCGAKRWAEEIHRKEEEEGKWGTIGEDGTRV